MVTSDAPYYGQTKEELKKKILKESPRMFSYFTKNLKDILKKLLDKKADKRLGLTGSEEIKNHPWFNGFDWNALINKSMQPPFLPKVTADNDVSNFDETFTKE